MKLTRIWLLAGLATLWAAFLALSMVQWNGLQLLNIIGFAAIIVCLGLPAYLALRIGKQPLWIAIASVIGLALLLLMVGVTFCNAVLPLFGHGRPLDPTPLRIELSVLFAVVAAIAWRRLRGVTYRMAWPKVSWLNALFVAVPLGFIALSVMGATLLNNGGGGWLTLAMLCAMAIYLGFLLVLRKRLSDTTIATAFFLLAIALLFMTSLRGWLTTGHDIQREFRMFQLAKIEGLWDIASYRDAYNACLSITVLPTVFANLLHISDPYVYKVLFQLLFAVVPVIVYHLVRRYAQPGMAILATIYFIAFPTFFSDMPMLNRQEIAFIFLALMLYIIFDKRIGLWKRRGIFLLFGVGMVLAHYSTTYSFVVIMSVLLVSRPMFRFLAAKLRNRKWFRNSGVTALTKRQERRVVIINATTIGALCAIAFLWNTVLTNTSQGLANIAKQLGASISSGFKADSRSNDTSYSIVSVKRLDPQSELEEYQKKMLAQARSGVPARAYYDDTTVAAYPLTALPPDSSPLTPLGQWLTNQGFDVPLFNYGFKQTFARLLQVFIGIGLLFVLFSKRFNKSLDTDFLLVVGASIGFIVLQIALPFLSVEYGLLRAFQQSLMVLGLFIAIGTAVIVVQFGVKWLPRVVPAVFALVFFVASTGALSQVLGGYTPVLHLSNAGVYYDIYYLHKGEIAAINWLAPLIAGDNAFSRLQSEVQSDRYAFTKLRAVTDLSIKNDITPGFVRKDSYVFMSYTNIHKQQATISYNGDLVTYRYPINFLDDNKNLVYSNGDARIYR